MVIVILGSLELSSTRSQLETWVRYSAKLAAARDYSGGKTNASSALERLGLHSKLDGERALTDSERLFIREYSNAMIVLIKSKNETN